MVLEAMKSKLKFLARFTSPESILSHFLEVIFPYIKERE